MKRAVLNVVYAAAVAAIWSCSPAPNSSTTSSGTAGGTAGETTGDTAGATGGATAGTTGGATAGTTGGDTAGTTGGATTGGATGGGTTTGGATGGTGGSTGGDGLPTTGGGTTGGGGSTGGTGGDPQGLSCSGVLQCLGGCQDQACATQCIGSGSPAAQQLVGAVASCLQTACPAQDEACVEAALTGACAAQFNACASDGGDSGGGTTGGGTPGGGTGGGGGASSCSAAFSCVGMCQDANCAGACLQNMDQDSGMLWNAFAMCIQTACPDQNDAACQQMAFQTTCAQQLQACMGDTMKPGVGAEFETMQYIFWRPLTLLMSHMMNFEVDL